MGAGSPAEVASARQSGADAAAASVGGKPKKKSKGRESTASEKLADYSSGSSYNWDTGDYTTSHHTIHRDERLPSMHGWVPREMIERAHGGLDRGLSPEDVVEHEGDRGNIFSPVVGGLLGAGLGLKFEHPAGFFAGGALGAGLGALGHHLTRGGRERRMQDTMRGVQRERSAIQGQSHSTASEPASITVQGAGGEGT